MRASYFRDVAVWSLICITIIVGGLETLVGLNHGNDDRVKIVEIQSRAK